MEERSQKLIEECRRLEESCLSTSTTLFEWVKSLRFWKWIFVLTPLILGGIANWSLLTQEDEYKWVTSICALLAGLALAIYKALDLDVNLNLIGTRANETKILQDRFRQAWRVTALGPFEDFKKEFDGLMARLDAARSSSPVAPERFFEKAKKKIQAGHYSFAVDSKPAE